MHASITNSFFTLQLVIVSPRLQDRGLTTSPGYFLFFSFFKMLVDLIQCTLSKCSKWVLASDPSLSKTKGTQLSIDVLKCAYPPLRFGSIQDPSIFRSNSKQVKNHASQWVLHSRQPVTSQAILVPGAPPGPWPESLLQPQPGRRLCRLAALSTRGKPTEPTKCKQ